MLDKLKAPCRIHAGGHTSYSQSGEDLIVKYIFDAMGLKNPTYIDIGANDPWRLSNTALFYQSGSRGINIEPNPNLFEKIVQTRTKDINLNIGVSDVEDELDFYVVSVPSLSTFSKKEADRYVREHGYHIETVMRIRVETLPNLISLHSRGRCPDFLSLDVEGLELRILQSINYDSSFPIVICVETISFSETGQGTKNDAITKFLESKGYMVYADTYINTIFVSKDIWLRQQGSSS